MSSKPFVVLIHGLHQRGFIMQPLAKRLQTYGYRTHNHDYRSLKETIEQHSKSLNNWLMTHHNPAEAINLVGHSLGGLVIRDFIHRYPRWQIGRCVTLGTPHLGSVSADYIKQLISPLVGQAYQGGLDGTVAPLDDDICLGVIAGNSPYGLGQPFLRYHNYRQNLDSSQQEHDGTVYVSETQLPNAADHIILPVSHTGMLVNKEVARQTAYFLEHGRFDH
ncbi:MAG: alpha/beta hydrolase [Psychrobacter sp.]|nr:alpha/beta hydrolase [Psychrobacter sp.]